jgi:toxin ParE1/3/4
MASEDLIEATAFIARDSSRYAKELVREARAASRTLRRFPERGRMVPEYEDPGLRELIVGRYRLVYRLPTDSAEVLAFIDGARDLTQHPGVP